MDQNKLQEGLNRMLKRGNAESVRLQTREEVQQRSLPSGVKKGRRSESDEPVWDRRRNYITSVVFDKEQYIRVREYAFANRLPIKEVLFRLIEAGFGTIEKEGRV